MFRLQLSAFPALAGNRHISIRCWIAVLGLGLAGQAAAQPPTSGTISVAIDAGDQSDAVRAVYVAAVGDALTARGFTLIDGAGHAGLVAEIRLSRADVGLTTAKVASSRADVGAGGVLGVGGRLSIPLPTAKTREVPLQQTRLDIRIARRDGDAAVWQGAAVTVRTAETTNGQDTAVARNLSEALLRAYPMQPEDVLSVP